MKKHSKEGGNKSRGYEDLEAAVRGKINGEET